MSTLYIHALQLLFLWIRILKDPKVGEKLDTYGYIPLHYSAQNNKLETTLFLLTYAKVQPDTNECGATALHRSAYRGHYEICKLLLAHGACINVKDISFGDLRTPLHKAVQSGNKQLIDFLVEQGADVNALDRDGLKPFELKSTDSLDNNSYDELNLNVLCLPSRKISVSKTTTKVVNSAMSPPDGVCCYKCGKVSLTFHRIHNNNLICMSCKNPTDG